MFVFASFTKEDRQRVREFKKDLMSKLTDKKVDSFGQDSKEEATDKSLIKNDKAFSKTTTLDSFSPLNINPEKEIDESFKLNNEISTNSNSYSSKEKEGTIGAFSDKEEDEISDNFFTIDIPIVNKENITAYLEYDLFGLASHESVPRSINHNIAIGGGIVVPNAQWSHQKEAIGTDLIKTGLNSILFTSPTAGVKYKIKNLKLVFEKDKKSDSQFNISSVVSGDQLYVKGNNILSTDLNLNNEHVTVKKGEFEKIIQLSDKDKANGLFSIVNGGISNNFKIPSTTKSFKIVNSDYANAKGIEISKDKEFNIAYENMNVSIEKETSESAYIEVLKLREKDFPATSQGLKNITLGNAAYRFSVVSGKLNKKVKLSIPYDQKRLGLFSPKEIKVFHFDYVKKEWVIDSSAAVDEKTKTVTVEGDGNNDYINGIISTPESPQLNAFAPTSISGLKAGDPMAGIQLMDAPTANQKGDINTNYPIDVPSGLGGLQPSLSIGYNSGSGNGWMGEGWDVQGVSAITIDTRWGTPQFDGATETELYSIDGEMLVYPNNYLPHRHNDESETNTAITTDKQPRGSYTTNGAKQFYLRKNHDFSTVERLGDSPTNYSWKVTSTDGTKSYYGGNDNSVLKSSNDKIIHWGLRLVEDPHGNTMEYTYQNTVVALGPASNLTGGTYFHIQKIAYGKNKDYTVNFVTQAGISRNDLSINGKQGVKRVEPYLLTNIDVRYQGELIRTYKNEYETGQFSKTRLRRLYLQAPILGDKFLIFGDYNFDYYDDVADGPIFGPDTIVQVDNAEKPYLSLIQSALNPSKINGNSAYEWGLNFRPAIGFNLFYTSNNAYGHVMFGVPFGFSNAEAKNFQQLIDFNGDGIQDMIYRVPDKGLYYSEGVLSLNGSLSFLKAKLIMNFNSNFSYSKTRSSNWGFDMGLQVLSNSTINSKSLITTSTYLTDANSDGLMDIVNNGDVWFNKYNNTENTPEMTKYSEYTENMIVKAKAVATPQYIKTDASISEPAVAPIDVVRVWVAPKDGYVRFFDDISAFEVPIVGEQPVAEAKAIYSVEILNPNNSGNNMRIYMGELLPIAPQQIINITNYNTYFSQIASMLPFDPVTNHLGVDLPSRLYVKSGDKIYVRLHKNLDNNLQVISNPVITYVDGNTGEDIINTTEFSQEGFFVNNGSYTDNFFMNNTISPILLDAKGKATIKVAPIVFPYTTDKFTFDIIAENLTTNTVSSLMPGGVPASYNQNDSSFQTFDIGTTTPAIVVDVPPNQQILLKFIVTSDSHTSFVNYNWNKLIKVVYEAETNTGNATIRYNGVPQYPSYVVTQFSKKTDIKDPAVNNNIFSGIQDYKVQLNKVVSNYNGLGIGSFYYVIKKGTKVLAKRKVVVDGGNSNISEQDMSTGQTISGISPITFFTGDVTQPDLANDRLINIQVYCNTEGDYALYKKYSEYFQNKPFEIYYGANNYLTSVIHTSINSTIYNSKTLIYNNWGQFLYNSSQDSSNATGVSDSYGRLINGNLFSNNVPAQQTYSQCNQYANQPDLLYQCISNSIPPTNNIGGTASGSPISPMKINVVSARQNRIIEKWVGTNAEQFSMRDSFRNEEATNSYFSNPIPDAPNAPPVTLTSSQISVNTTMKAIDKKQSSQSQNKTTGVTAGVSLGNSVTTLTGHGSVELQNFMDLNGDGYPDVVYPDSMQLTNATGGLQGQQASFIVGDFLTNSFSKQQVNSVGFSYSGFSAIARGDVFGLSQSTTQADGSMGWSGDVSSGVNDYYDSTDYGQRFWLDINGDGLPDRITGGGSASMDFDLNIGNTLLGSQKFENLKAYRSHPVGGQSISLGGGLGSTTSLQSLGSFGFGVNAGVGASSSIGTADVIYEDINGDGLIDILDVNSNQSTSVSYNLGNKFDVAKPLLKTGSAVDFTQETQSYNGSLSFGANFMLNIGPFFIVPMFPVLILYLKGGLGANANFGLNVSETTKTFKDMNGDGFVDLVVDNGGDSFIVNYSKIGRTNKLKQITSRITQSKYIVDYSFTQPNYKDPHAKLVVKEVKVLNPDVFDSNYTNSDVTKDIVTQYEFKNSKYDRRERDNFGFETVIRKEMEGANAVFRKSVDTYYNNSYFLNGMIKESKVLTGSDLLLSKLNYTYQLYKFRNNTTQIDLNNPLSNADMEDFDTGGKEGRKMATVLLYRKDKAVYENGGNILTKEKMNYTDKGLIANYEYISPTKSYNSAITYWDGLSNNIIAVPKEINVYQGITNSVLMRKRKSLNPNPVTGDIGKFVVFDGTNDIETDFTYNSNGNIASVEYPPNETGQRYMLSYEYDTQTNKYTSSVSDSFGLTSTAEYLPKFDAIKKSVDITGNIMQYNYDDAGRIMEVVGPNEFGTNNATIQYGYFYENYGIPNTNADVKIFRARTSHYDAETPSNFINIDTYADFLGRVIQVKKDIEIDGVERRSVSGRSIFDLHGRAIKQYHPTVENVGTIQNISLSLATNFSTAQYDVLDRVIEETPETNLTKFIEYEISGDLFKTTEKFDVTKSETYANIEGQIVKKADYLDTTPLETLYQYNPAGDLISVTDPENISTTYTYNLAGRRIGMKHPDKGKLKYDYDPAGNLIRLVTPNLAYDPNVPANIHYEYDYNRLSDIALPNLPNGNANPNNVHYSYLGANLGNNSGKLSTKSDGTGNTIYTYGKMGEVVSENRTVYGYNIPTMNFKTYFSYDSWNRIKQINYPDGEEVSYKYDLGGNLKSVSNTDQDYIKDITYDVYGQRTHIKYGNGTEASYNYYPANRRLSFFSLTDATSQALLNNDYKYDPIGNITRIYNDAVVSPNEMGGSYTFDYKYDTLNRLIGTDGSQKLVDKGGNPVPTVPSPYPQGNALFALKMEYNESGGIANKMQKHHVNQQIVPQNNYDNFYKYNAGTHKLKEIIDVAFGNSQTFAYDLNGNLTSDEDNSGMKRMFWDEQDRMKAFYNDDSGVYQYYAYDDSGERTIKYNMSTSSQLYQNGVLVDPGSMTLKDYKLYPNPYVVVTSDGQYTKNYFEGSTRFASRIKDGTDIFIPTTTKGANTNQDIKEVDPETDFKTYLEKVGVEGNVSVELAGKAGGSGGQAGLYYLHGDHLGTANFVTDDNSKTTQFFLNLPFGETMLEQQIGVYDNPYKFNAKELDKETGLYYYGARYYNPRLSIWYGVDPLAVYNPVMETQFYGDGQHNGGVYNLGNLNPYIYTYQNPIKYIDPNGKQTVPMALQGFTSTAATGGSLGTGIMSGGFAALPVAGIIILYNSDQLMRRFNANRAWQENHITLKEQKEAYLQENYPAAEKDNLIARSFPRDEQKGMTILNSNKAKLSNAKLRGINDKLREIDAGKSDGHAYLNDGRDGSEILPKKGENGNIDYTTYDLNKPPTQEQRKNGATRDKTRIVTGSDGSAYITNRHYKNGSFKKIR